MMELDLTRGFKAIIDKDDYEKISHLKWHASTTSDGHTYAKNIFKRKSVLLHRIIMKAKKGQIVDHINRDTLDNRKCNLRFVNDSLNNMNQKRRNKKETIYRGVYRYSAKLRTKCWVGRIQFKKIVYFLGYFHTDYEAHLAVKNKFIELFGENHNYPLEYK